MAKKEGAKATGGVQQPVPAGYIPALQKKYKEEIVAALMKEFNYKSIMQVPRLEKIIVNQGVGSAVNDKKLIEVAQNELTTITGQKAIQTFSKKDISNFKLRKGVPIGVKVTLRRAKMYEFLDRLVASGYSPEIVRQVEDMNEYDIYDVLVNIAYGAEPQRRQTRAFSFTYKQRPWLGSLPEETKSVILAIANQFVDGGTEAFENQFIFDAQTVKKAGGMAALKKGGDPRHLIHEAKLRMFAA